MGSTSRSAVSCQYVPALVAVGATMLVGATPLAVVPSGSVTVCGLASKKQVWPFLRLWTSISMLCAVGNVPFLLLKLLPSQRHAAVMSTLSFTLAEIT